MISDREAAKYPFLKDAIALVDTLDLTLEDLVDPGYTRVLDRAEDRVSQAIVIGRRLSSGRPPPSWGTPCQSSSPFPSPTCS